MGATCGKMCESEFCGGPVDGPNEVNTKYQKGKMKGNISRSS